MLMESDGLRRELGARAARRVREAHDVSVGGQKIMRIIEDTIRGEW
jgi:hypothetical protein